jgi:hypothetical protein
MYSSVSPASLEAMSGKLSRGTSHGHQWKLQEQRTENDTKYVHTLHTDSYEPKLFHGLMRYTGEENSMGSYFNGPSQVP